MDRINKLVEIGGDALIPSLSKSTFQGLGRGSLFDELATLLSEKNGFYAFEASLHVRPFGRSEDMGLEEWNTRELWKKEYGELVDGLFFFAEDIFGNQFCLADAGVVLFDAETGRQTKIAPDLEGWADCILADYNYLTGYPVAHEWQKQNGAVPTGKRLVPKLPFVCGGKYEVSNLAALDAIKGMKWRGDLAQQLKCLPDGSQITLKVITPES